MNPISRCIPFVAALIAIAVSASVASAQPKEWTPALMMQVKKIGRVDVAPDGKQIAFTALDAPTAAEEQAKKDKNDARVVDENIKMSRLYVVAALVTEKPAPRLLTKGDLNVAASGRGGYDWAPDGKTIVFT